MKNNIVIYEGENGEVELQADMKKDTIWATQAQISALFDVNIPAINEHLTNIFKTNELSSRATIRNFRIVQNEGGREVNRKVKHYNLDAIIAVGYRVNSKKATQFRVWATKVLRNYILSGYSLDVNKIKKSPKTLMKLYETMALIDSEGSVGRLKGKVTIKLTEDFDPRK